MAIPEHLSKLNEGVEAWNYWRNQNPELVPDLSGSNLKGMCLQNINLEKAILDKTDLTDSYMYKSNLEEAHLENSLLIRSDLREANLFRADLSNANLFEANLRGADLAVTSVEDTIFLNTNLQDTRLYRVDFRTTTGLLASQLAGSDLSGARLPDEVLIYDGLKNVEETAKSAGFLFTVTLLICAYAWLAIANIQAASFVSKAAGIPLPIVNTQIPVTGLFQVVPFILLGIYVYFLLNLQNMWVALSDLPAVFPDGRTIDRRAYPWLMVGIVRYHFVRLKKSRHLVYKFQDLLTIFLAWWVVPLTLTIFWLRYLSVHDLAGTIVHVIFIIAAAVIGFAFYRLAVATLERRDFSLDI